MTSGVRDVLMFGLGAGAFLNEVFLSTIERPYILGGSLALMGLPFVVKGVVIAKNGRNGRNGRDA